MSYESDENVFIYTNNKEIDDKIGNLSGDILTRSINVMHPPSPMVAAKGDFSVDDYPAIQACLDYVYNLGGGIVFVPSGHYKTTMPLLVKDNVTLMGVGYSSWIENVTQTSYKRMPIMTGNIDSYSTGLFAEPKYNTIAITAGSKSITFAISTDVNNFSVGDMVFIQSAEKWATKGQDATTPKWMNMNLIMSITGSTLNLKYPIPDDYVTTNGSPTVSKFAGTLKGVDGLPNWMAKKATISNLRLSHTLGLSSGWYGIYAHGMECTFEKLWMNVSTPFGSNALGYSVIRDIIATFDGCASDLCDYQVNNIVDNVKLYRTAINTNLPQSAQGFGFHDGMDNILMNSEIHLANSGGINNGFNQRNKIINNKIYRANDSNNKAVITGCRGEGFVCKDNTIIAGTYHGVLLLGNKSLCSNNLIRSMNYTSGYYGVNINASVKDSIIESNTIGDNGTRTTQDAVYQQTAFDASNIIKNNVTYNTQLPKIQKAYTQTSSTTEFTMQSYTIKSSTTKKASAYKVFVAGYRTGINDIKTVKLKLGSTVIAQIDYAAADTQKFFMEAIITHNDYDVNARADGVGWKDTTCTYRNHQTITNGLSADTTIALTASVNNASDSVILETFIVDIIQ